MEEQATTEPNSLAARITEQVATGFDELRVMRRLDDIVSSVPGSAKYRVLKWLWEKHATNPYVTRYPD